MIIKCHKTFVVYSICYGGQGFQDDINELGEFETKREAEKYIKELNNKNPWIDIKIREVIEELE